MTFSGEGHVVIRFGAKVVRSLRAKPFRALIVVVLTLALALCGFHLWAWYHFREANRLVEQQQFAKAYSHYALCLQVWRWSASTHFLAARTARRANLYPEARQHLAESGRLQGGASSTSVPLALEHLLLQAQSGDIGEVEEALWGYVKKEKPETPLILEAMARGYSRMLRLGTAMRCLRMLLEREPDNVEALVLRGWIREGGGEAEARQDYRRALELNPEQDDARLGLARILVRDSPKEAHSHFEHLVARQPDNPDALLGLAEAYRALGEPEKGRPLLDAVLAKDPENSKALAELGALSLAAGKTTEGEALLRKAIAADPGNVEAHYQLYLCLVQQPGREADAAVQRDTHKRVEADRRRLAQIASKEMTRTPNDPNLHYEVGVIYLRNGKPEVGVRWLYNALKLDSTHQPSHQALYDYFKRTGQSEKAEQHRAEIGPGTAQPAPAQP
jgi:tetratricopeptide (TPR) repeat protein